MKKNQILMLFLLFFMNNTINGQKNTDTSRYLTGFESGYHNTAVLQAPKGRFFYKNTEIIYQSFGKNFFNLFEIELGGSHFASYESAQLKTRFNIPFSETMSIGGGFSAIGYDGGWILNKSDKPYSFRDKYEATLGVIIKDKRFLHSYNINYGQLIYHYRTSLQYRAYGYSFTYLFVYKFDSNIVFILDNKIFYIDLNYFLPHNYGDKNFWLLEQNSSIRLKGKKLAVDIGWHTFLGYRNETKQVKYAPYPYFSAFFVF